MAANARLIVTSYIIATISGLFSDVVAGYIVPAFEQRRGLAVIILLIFSAIGIELALRQHKSNQAVRERLLTLFDKARLDEILHLLLNTRELSLSRDRGAFLQLALLPSATADESQTDLYSKIDLEGAPQTFALNLLDTLLQTEWFEQGKMALCALLIRIGEQSGVDVQTKVHELLPRIKDISPKPSPVIHYSLLYRYASPVLRPYLVSIPLLAIVVALFSPLVSDVWAQHAPECPPDRTCILVARFGPQDDATAHAVTDDVLAEVRAVLDAAYDKRFTVRQVPTVASEAEAQEVARQQRALLIIWGEVQTSIRQLRIDFELTDLLGAGESTDVRVLRVEPQAYDPVVQGFDCSGCLYLEAAVSEEVAQRARIIAYTAIGLLHYVEGNPEEARFDFGAALSCIGESVNTILPGLPTSSCRPVEQSTQSTPGLLYYYLGRALGARGDYAAAIAVLKQAAELNPQDPAAHIGMGLVYQRWLNDRDGPAAVLAFETALALTQKALQNRPQIEWATIYYNQGMIHELLTAYVDAQADYREAVHRYQEARKRNGHSVISEYTATVAFGRVQRKAGDLAAAQETLQQAVSLAPESPWAYLELAYADLDNPRRARQWPTQAARQTRREPYVEITRAELCTQWQDYVCADEAYSAALEIRPGSGWLHSRVGDFYRLRITADPTAFWDQMAFHYEQAVLQRPCDPWAHDRAAYAFTGGPTRSYSEATKHYWLALQLLHPDTAPDVIERLNNSFEQANGLAEEEDFLPAAEELSSCFR